MAKNLDVINLFDIYGEMLTQKQQDFICYYYNDDLSLAEIAQELNVSRQGVHDNLSRAEALLLNMEAKTGCVSRDLQCRKSAKAIIATAQQLAQNENEEVSRLANAILAAARALEE